MLASTLLLLDIAPAAADKSSTSHPAGLGSSQAPPECLTLSFCRLLARLIPMKCEYTLFLALAWTTLVVNRSSSQVRGQPRCLPYLAYEQKHLNGRVMTSDRRT
ncbi:uncharacterized protein LY79DRAFT_573089 [Colletotrichum navitas]|uniref:Secreted protein n=1 Tax=Colletotrichum navitas TaxID=681940 RepID=A0AAD8UXJ5_9PEZI|nr:uncharacterized protein LY79DRAFT_573089 [Colletotrichum navitas]KAK1565924.1 hypothetical protein LY79DRAFT_573089 [Colletotrichum navitas]